MQKLSIIFMCVVLASGLFTGCDEGELVWEGDFYTGDHGYTVDALKGYTAVTGKLLIYDTLEENLNDLSSLRSVGSNLILSGNYRLKNIDGLTNLTALGGQALYFVNNESLQTIDGVKNIRPKQAELTVYIENNESLKNIDGLIWLKYVDQLTVYGNTLLENIDGLSNLENISEHVDVYQPTICQSELDIIFEDVSLPSNNSIMGDDGC